MLKTLNRRPKYVIGPDGSPLTLAHLPPPNTTKRWSIRRKAEMVAAVRGGLLSLDEACSRYMLTVEEFLNWEDDVPSGFTRGCAARDLQILMFIEDSESTNTVWRNTERCHTAMMHARHVCHGHVDALTRPHQPEHRQRLRFVQAKGAPWHPPIAI